jgi:predicted DNA-binding transcriptional regulator YafY
MLEYDFPPADQDRANAVHTDGVWRVMPLAGHFQLDYRDVTGRRTRRALQALELKVGPGKVLLGGIDEATQAYRGFRADRISRLQDLETSETVDRNILDWLMRHADRQNRPRRRSMAQAA